MRAIQYEKSVWKYLVLRMGGKFFNGLYFSAISPLKLVEVPPPKLPSERWVRIRTLLGSICGSDMKVVTCQGSPYFSPFTSFPFVLGHENVGVVEQTGRDVTLCRSGDRVVVEPMLHCEIRGIKDLCEDCRKGQYSLCKNVTKGDLSEGLQTGYCRDTGGSWGEYFVAHESQVHVLPASISNEDGVLIEPFSTALHAVLQNKPETLEKILIYGGGSIGLLVLQALRGCGFRNEISMIVRYAHQAVFAKKLGADHVFISNRSLYAKIAEYTQAQVFTPELGKKVLLGGFDRTFDCVGSDTSLDDSFRFTDSRGVVVLVGMPAVPKHVDWTSAWAKELRIVGSFCYGWENLPEGRQKTFNLAIQMLQEGKIRLAQFITHSFSVEDYMSALKTVLKSKGRNEVVKVAIHFQKS